MCQSKGRRVSIGVIEITFISGLGTENADYTLTGAFATCPSLQNILPDVTVNELFSSSCSINAGTRFIKSIKRN